MSYSHFTYRDETRDGLVYLQTRDGKIHPVLGIRTTLNNSASGYDPPADLGGIHWKIENASINKL